MNHPRFLLVVNDQSSVCQRADQADRAEQETPILVLLYLLLQTINPPIEHSTPSTESTETMIHKRKENTCTNQITETKKKSNQSFGDGIDCVDDAREVAQDSQQEAQPELQLMSTKEEEEEREQD